jgi:hypothetical protein
MMSQVNSKGEYAVTCGRTPLKLFGFELGAVPQGQQCQDSLVYGV